MNHNTPASTERKPVQWIVNPLKGFEIIPSFTQPNPVPNEEVPCTTCNSCGKVNG